ncbi:hypothetical protein C8R48DRAFT_780081 [Suillus tomentosus]|nr:hypothetical protein C8R48DRAFT_780081 [Suillus tomentosus]
MSESRANLKRALRSPGASSDGDDEPTPKRVRGESTSPLEDEGAWRILFQYLTTEMTYPQMEEEFISYLGDRYCANDWKDARDALFSADDLNDNATPLANLQALYAKHVPQASSQSNMASPLEDSGVVSASRTLGRSPDTRKSHPSRRSRQRPKPKNPFIDVEADEGSSEDEDDDDDDGSRSLRSPNVTSLPGPSGKQTFFAAVDNIFNHVNTSKSSDRRLQVPYRAAWCPGTIESRMYLLHVHRAATGYIASHLRSKGLPVTVSAWIPGQIYVVSDSPKTIASFLPTAHKQSVRDYLRISDEERQAVERERPKLPNPGWVRIVQRGKYKGDIGYVYDSEQSDDFVAVLISPRDFPYPVFEKSAALLDRSRLPANSTVSDITHDGKVVGCSFKGERYYMGLLLKKFHHSDLELVTTPHPDCIRLHLQSGWDTPFVKRTELAFSTQFLRVGDEARVISAEMCSEIGKVVSANHDFRLRDVERVFRLGDSVRVVAGVYLGLEGHVVQMSDNIFHICQEATKEEIEVSKHYLDRRPLKHVLQNQLPAQPTFEPPPETESIEIGDYVDYLADTTQGNAGSSPGSGPAMIKVLSIWIRRTRLAPTIKYTKDKGYDVGRGDFVNVARGPEYQTTGVVQNVDFPSACLTLLSQTDSSLVNVPMRFVVKTRNAAVDTFKNVIGKEVFVIQGQHKGYRATLYDIGREHCSVALPGQKRIMLKLSEVVTSYGMRLNGTILERHDLISFCEMRKKSYLKPPPRSITPPPEKIASSSSLTCSSDPPSSALSTWTANPEAVEGAINQLLAVDSTTSSSESSFDPWTVNPEDNEVRQEQVKYDGPLPWLMKKEFASTFLTHHVVLKVSPSFMGGRLHKRFVSTACPDPFCGANGPAPENCVAAFCTSNGTGAAIQHYHIPAHDLSPAPPRKKNQQCLILDGEHRGAILTIAKCNIKKNTVEMFTDPDTIAPTLKELYETTSDDDQWGADIFNGHAIGVSPRPIRDQKTVYTHFQVNNSQD